MKAKKQTFADVLELLGISEFHDRIWYSSSTGELHHIGYFISMASAINGLPKERREKHRRLFSTSFRLMVKWVDKYWDRPDSVFQHVPKLLDDFTGFALAIIHGSISQKDAEAVILNTPPECIGKERTELDAICELIEKAAQ